MDQVVMGFQSESDRAGRSGAYPEAAETALPRPLAIARSADSCAEILTDQARWISRMLFGKTRSDHKILSAV